MKQTNNRGFILIIVVGLLGVLGTLGVQMHGQGRLSRQLADNSSDRVRLRLLARSGIELGVEKAILQIRQDPVAPLRGTDIGGAAGVSWSVSVGHPADVVSVSIKDASGCLNINDGVVAGLLELGSGPFGYRSQALDPWSGTDTISDTSAWINIRIRRLLNAYGDVHRFMAQRGHDISGFPGHEAADWPLIDTEEEIFQFTSTACGPRGTSMPSRDCRSEKLTAAAPLALEFDPVTGRPMTIQQSLIADHGLGLGDRIIAMRPTRGWKRLEDIRDIVDDWGRDLLDSVNPGYLKGERLFDLIRDDLTVASWHDDEVVRQVREFGPGYDSDFTVQQTETSLLDLDPPDLSNLFRRHPMPPVNINAASRFVRAALFYAPVNPSFVAEDHRIDGVNQFTGTYLWQSHYMGNPTLGVCGPKFKEIREQGLKFDVPDYDFVVQRERLMSLKDAMILASVYEEVTVTDPDGFGYPTCTTEFAALLASIREEDRAPAPERALSTLMTDNNGVEFTAYPIIPDHESENDTRYWFRKDYLERCLPHLFSPVRRLPSWMGAPVALSTPYLDAAQRVDYAAEQSSANMTPSPKLARISVEDLVFRSHLPKIMFLSGGIFRVSSRAENERGSSALDCSRLLFESRKLRSQESMMAHRDVAASAPDVRIGPEPHNGTVAPHEAIGVIGLYPREMTAQGQRPVEAHMSFDDRSTDPLAATAPGGGVVFLPKDMNADPTLGVTVLGTVAAWPSAHQGKPFPLDMTRPFSDYGPVFFNDLGTVEGGRTWRQPRAALDVLQQFLDSATMGGMSLRAFIEVLAVALPDAPESPTDEISMKEVLRYHWTAYLCPGTTPPDMSATLEEYLWRLSAEVGGMVDGEITWETPGTVTWWDGETWSNGLPTGEKTHDTTVLAQSALEGRDVSIFAGGSSGSDLSPFGGIMLSARGHGPRAAGLFNDSLFFRPTDLMEEGTEDFVARDFNKGLVSFWFRVPTGSQRGSRVLMSLTVWERFQTPGVGPAWSQPGESTQPSDITVVYDMDNRLVHTLHSNRFNSHVLYGNDVELAVGERPPGDDYDEMWQFMRVPRPGDIPDRNPSWQEVERYLDPDRDMVTEQTRCDVSWGGHGKLTPGSWQRVIVAWDYSRMNLEIEKRFWGALPGWWSGVSRLPGYVNGHVRPMASNNSQMLLAFGELPYYFDHENMDELYLGSKTRHDDGLDGFPDQGYLPMFRLNSQIDGLDIHLGDADDRTTWFGHSDASMEDRIADIEADPGFNSSRYPVGPGQEPVVDFDFSSLPGWIGGRLVSAGAGTYDVPVGDALNVPGASAFNGAAPRVDLEIEDQVGMIDPTVAFVNRENVLTHMGYRVGAGILGRRLMGTSPQRHLYGGELLDETTRIRLRFRNENVSGDPLIRAVNAPWVQELSVRYVPSDNGRVIHWEERR